MVYFVFVNILKFTWCEYNFKFPFIIQQLICVSLILFNPFLTQKPHFYRPIVYPLQVPWYSGMFALGGEWAARFPFFDALCDYVMYMSSYGIDRTSILDPICVEQDAIIKKVHLFILKHQCLNFFFLNALGGDG